MDYIETESKMLEVMTDFPKYVCMSDKSQNSHVLMKMYDDGRQEAICNSCYESEIRAKAKQMSAEYRVNRMMEILNKK